MRATSRRWMRSFGRALTATLVVAAVGLVADLRAQGAETLYRDQLAREAELRKALDLAPQLRTEPPGMASTDLLRRVRAAVTDYEGIVRRFPRSGYSDNALWQGGLLAADAFWQFGDTRDKATALRLLGRLAEEFPTSSLVAKAAE